MTLSRGIQAHDDRVPFDIISVSLTDAPSILEDNSTNCLHYRVTLECEGRQTSVYYGKGIGIRGRLKRRVNHKRASDPSAGDQYDYIWENWQQPYGKKVPIPNDVVPIPPQITEVSDAYKMDCRAIRDNPTFQDFADELGYDTDSIKNRDVYFACQDSYNKMRKLLGSKFWKWLDSPSSDEEVEQEEQQSASDQIEALFNQAVAIGLKHVETIARDILKTHPELTEFTMAMGSYTFTESRPDNAVGIELGGDERDFFKPLFDFMNDWDKYLKLTGSPMRFTADGPVVTEW